MKLRIPVCIGADRANGADSHLEPGSDLRAVVFSREKCRRCEHRSQHLTDVAAGLLECLGHASDQRLWRIVRDELASQFRRDEFRRRRMSGQQSYYLVTVLYPAARI